MIQRRLLGICFRREAPEIAVWPDRRAGKRGRKGCFGESVGGVAARTHFGPQRERTVIGGFTDFSNFGERMYPGRFAKIILAAVFLNPVGRVRCFREPGCARRPNGLGEKGRS